MQLCNIPRTKLPFGRGGVLFPFFLCVISCFYHSEKMYWLTLNVKMNFKEFVDPQPPLLYVPACIVNYQNRELHVSKQGLEIYMNFTCMQLSVGAQCHY